MAPELNRFLDTNRYQIIDYRRAEKKKKNSLMQATFVTLGRDKYLKFKRKVWDGNNYFSIDDDHSKNTCKRRRKFVTGPKSEVTLSKHTLTSSLEPSKEIKDRGKKPRCCYCKI